MRGPDWDRVQIEKVLGLLCQPEGDGAHPELSGLSEAGEALMRFLDELPGGILIYRGNPEEELVYANRAVLRIFRCGTLEELRTHAGNSFRGLVHPDDLAAVEESIRAQASGNQELSYVEYRIYRRDGAVGWIESYGRAAYTEQLGDLFYVFLGDATERKEQRQQEAISRINAELEKEREIQDLIQEYDMERNYISQEYIRQLEVIEGLSINYDTICYVDLDQDQVVPYRLGERVSILLYEKLSDRSYAKFAACYVKLWVHPEDRELLSRSTAPDYIREKLAETRTYYVNYRVLAEGETQYFQIRVVNVGHDDGVNQIVLGYRRMDEEFQQQKEQQALLADALAKANLAITSKNTFLSNMSHDMRTPLHAIFGFTSLAKVSPGISQEAMGHLERVEAASRKLLDMIDKVLEVSALSDGARLEERECDLREVLRQVGGMIFAQAQEKNITFKLDDAGLDGAEWVYADAEKLRQLMVHLGTNAVTFTEPGGRVAIIGAQTERLPSGFGVYRFAVEDTGVGVSPEFIERIFEPFSRERNSTQTGVHGVGLGLTIAKSIVDMMGGSLDVESTVGKGSTFTVTLILQTREDARPSLSQEPPETPPVQSVQRILLVEDNELNREIEMELLSRQGYAIDTAENGLLAVEMVKRAGPEKYDLVLMDIQMPVMDGWQAAREIRALADPVLAQIPIVALSANVLERDRNMSKTCGINVHLVKPMELSLVVSTIEELTGKKRPVPNPDGGASDI